MAANKMRGQQISAGGHSILELPNEVLHEVAIALPTDKDLIQMSLSCKELMARILAPESGVWRGRFQGRYNVPAKKANNELMFEYITRAIVLKAKIDFKEEEDDRQRLWMRVLRTMLQESLTLPFHSLLPKTLKCIGDVLQKTNFLAEPLKPGKRSELFYALQLCLSALSLDSAITQPCRRTDYDMEHIYSIEKGTLGDGFMEDESEDFNASETSSQSSGAETDESEETPEDDFGSPDSSDSSLESTDIITNQPTSEPQPFIDHKTLDLALLLEFHSFWQRHLLSYSEHTFYESFQALPDELKPQVRKEDPSKASLLSTFWMGYYSCIHPFPFSLDDLEHRQTCGTHEDEVEAMTLELTPHPDLFWPSACNKAVPLAKGVKTVRVAFEGKQGMHGPCPDENDVFGFTEEIEVAYGGIQGWKRICFAICERVDNEPADLSEGTDGWVHVYEAVIIPGGRTMLGRWMDLKEPSAKGPFIFWDV
ncbi:hypothetical protein N7452_011315 [Penicillium brevicompactum]|uniref:F-box domain-containing protein n=1 Tax=Penicillium brevicompactum TaxID=5074 RepID=A0A9W9U6R1_PENBR|nr:hypothetical protein N7452_011315 [Penicillium brevicompactum]